MEILPGGDPHVERAVRRKGVAERPCPRRAALAQKLGIRRFMGDKVPDEKWEYADLTGGAAPSSRAASLK